MYSFAQEFQGCTFPDDLSNVLLIQFLLMLFFRILFIYFWLRWVFVAVGQLSRGEQGLTFLAVCRLLPHCCDFSCAERGLVV